MDIQPKAIRVPLDIRRLGRPPRQWRPLSLSENRVGTNVELVAVLEDARRLQRRTGGSLPFLVDEKVHYAVMRMMHSPLLGSVDMLAWLHRVPLVYGVWHPYKQCVVVVYRTFYPIFALLECTGRVTVGAELRVNRKLLYMEKVLAGLLLCAKDMIPLVRRAIATSTDDTPTHH